MSSLDAPQKSMKQMPLGRRKVVTVNPLELVKLDYLEPGQTLPLVVTPAVEGVNLIDWVKNNREWLEGQLAQHGTILFRNFDVKSIPEFEQFIAATSSAWAEYREAATPRHAVSDKISTSTDYPASQTIYLHNENSHTESWPLKLYFYCVTPAEEGGETPLADCRKIYQRLSPALRDRFAEKQIMYVRNFGEGLGFPWQKVFKTESKAEVEEYCRQNGITPEWKDGDRLRIRYIRRASGKHPRTGEMTWFNHATFFHVSTLDPAMREALLSTLKEEDLPYNTYYGDGSPIEPAVLDELHAAYAAETIKFLWQQNDVEIIDNMSVCHGRSPFKGTRKVVVGMAEPFSSRDLQ